MTTAYSLITETWTRTWISTLMTDRFEFWHASQSANETVQDWEVIFAKEETYVNTDQLLTTCVEINLCLGYITTS